MIKHAAYIILSVLLSAGLILSIPVITIIVNEGFSFKKEVKIRKTPVNRITSMPQPQEQKKRIRRPRRRQSPRQSAKSGPRFAMALGAQGLGGVGVPLDLSTNGGVSNGTGDQGVDERPQIIGSFQLDIPDQIKAAEVNASLRLLFCVDVSGRPYDIKVTLEQPPSMGLAQAGIDALRNVTFSPAMLNAQAVPFCGMEQPVEIKFRN